MNLAGAHKGYLLLLAALTLLVMFDSRSHFDADLVQRKIENQSAQRNWSLFFSREHVYYNSSIRYQQDFAEIASLITPNHSVLSDLATSYYAAAALPVYAVNIHSHQGRLQRRAWHQILSSRGACRLPETAEFRDFEQFITAQEGFSGRPHLQVRYVLLNKDERNRAVAGDCLARNHQQVAMNLDSIATRIYSGQFLDLYELD